MYSSIQHLGLDSRCSQTQEWYIQDNLILYVYIYDQTSTKLYFIGTTYNTICISQVSLDFRGSVHHRFGTCPHLSFILALVCNTTIVAYIIFGTNLLGVLSKWPAYQLSLPAYQLCLCHSPPGQKGSRCNNLGKLHRQNPMGKQNALPNKNPGGESLLKLVIIYQLLLTLQLKI